MNRLTTTTQMHNVTWWFLRYPEPLSGDNILVLVCLVALMLMVILTRCSTGSVIFGQICEWRCITLSEQGLLSEKVSLLLSSGLTQMVLRQRFISDLNLILPYTPALQFQYNIINLRSWISRLHSKYSISKSR